MGEHGIISVAIADDHPVVLHGLESLIESEPDMTVVATAQDGDEAVRRVLATRPMVVVMDARMPGCDGVQATERILAAYPDARIIVLSGDEGPPVVQALKAGAFGFLSKMSITEGLIESIRDAAEGRPVVSSTFLRSVLEGLREAEQSSPLNARERQILELVAEGRTNEQIGRAIGLSLSTVKAELAALFDKVGAKDRASALAVCFRRGWLT
jgi:DNA-binding NarL/FixJ family response regulator